MVVAALRRLCARNCVLWSLPVGSRPFAHISADAALKQLRTLLAALGVVEADSFRTHDLRRGHAQDMVESGAKLVEILRAGDWK